MTEKRKEVLRSIKFVLISASAGIIQLGTNAIMLAFNINYLVSYLIPLILSVLWNFTINRRYTFKSANNVPLAMGLVFLFYCVFTPYSLWIESLIADKLAWPAIVATIINMIQNFILEYLYDRFIVFRKSLDTNDIAKKEEIK